MIFLQEDRTYYANLNLFPDAYSFHSGPVVIKFLTVLIQYSYIFCLATFKVIMVEMLLIKKRKVRAIYFRFVSLYLNSLARNYVHCRHYNRKVGFFQRSQIVSFLVLSSFTYSTYLSTASPKRCCVPFFCAKICLCL